MDEDRPFVDWSRGGPKRRHELAEGLYAFLPAVVTYPNEAGYSVTLTLDLVPEGLRPVDVQVTAREGSAPINGTTMRNLRLGELTRDAAESVINYAKPDDAEGPSPRRQVNRLFVRIGAEGLSRIDAAGGLGDEGLRRVATVYRVARVVGLPPQKYVQESFNVPRSTAGYWIQQARKRGHLD